MNGRIYRVCVQVLEAFFLAFFAKSSFKHNREECEPKRAYVF